jgi:hypothetical protein
MVNILLFCEEGEREECQNVGFGILGWSESGILGRDSMLVYSGDIMEL